MLTNVLSAFPWLLGGGGGGWGVSLYVAAYKPMVRAGTVGSVLTSA